jgi:hypothetical protein
MKKLIKIYFYVLVSCCSSIASEINLDGICLDVPIESVHSRINELTNNTLLQKHISSIKKIENVSMFSIGLYSIISSNKTNQVEEILLHGSVVDLLFNGWGLTPEQFAKRIMSSCKIKQMDFDGQNWIYINEHNIKLTISCSDKAITLRNLNAESNIAQLLNL